MASYRDEYYSSVDAIFDKLKNDPFKTPLPDPTAYEGSIDSGNIQPVGFIGDKAVIAGNIDDEAIAELRMFASTIRPVEVVGSLPALPDADYPEGSTVVLTTDGKLYRNFGDSWTAAVPTSDLSGTITETQIADDSISTPKLQANSVIGTKILAGEIGTDHLAANSIVAGKIAAGAIETSHFAVSARAPGVENSTSEVVIDPTGITILNGKITLADQGGISVLSSAGFAGSWSDYLATGVYNSAFDASGTTITASSVRSNPSTTADYVTATTQELPYWGIEEFGTGLTVERVADSFAPGGESLQITNGAAVTRNFHMYQDIPVTGSVPYMQQWWIETNYTVDSSGPALTFVGSSRDSDHALIGAEATVVHDYGTTLNYSNPVMGRMETASNAVYLRIGMKIAVPAGSVAKIGHASFYPAEISFNEIELPIYATPGAGIRLASDALYATKASSHSSMLVGQLLGDPFPAFDISSDGTMQWGTGLAGPAATMGFDNVDSAVEVNRLRITTTSDASLVSGAHGFQIGDTGGVNLVIDNNEIMARNNDGVSALNLNIEGGDITMGNASSIIGVSGRIDAEPWGRQSHKVAATTLTSGSTTQITGLSAVWTGSGMSGNVEVFIVDQSGIYLVTVQGSFASSAGGSRRAVGYGLNGAAPVPTGWLIVKGETGPRLSAAFMVQLAANDALRPYAFQDSGANLNVTDVTFGIIRLSAIP